MTVTTAPPQPPRQSIVRETPRLTSGRLPAWSPWAILAASAVISAVVFAIPALAGAEAFNLAGWAVVQATGAGV